MATLEITTASPKGEQKEKVLSPSEEAIPPVLDESLPPLNFSALTPSQFGISVQSFTPYSFHLASDKSRLAQIKARRRSNIGVRGSPETNSLIRFMAQQRMKTPPTSQTPELVRSSPFLPRVASTLRQKMASFQSLMDVEESDACDPMPTQDTASLFMPQCSKCVKKVAAYCPEITVIRATREEHCIFVHLRICFHTGEEDSTGTSTVKKKKQVRFGGPLSPEFFDKDLPPSTPLQKGAAPARAPTPGGSLQLRSVLKTPQRNESITPQSPPDLDSPTVFGASPVLAMPRNHRLQSEGEETEQKDGKVDKMPELFANTTNCSQLDLTCRNLHLPDKIVFFNNSGVITYSHLIYCLIPLHLNLITSGDFHFICVRERGRETVYIMYPQANCLFPQQPEESEPVKRSTRSAAKSASGKMKATSTAARRWNRDVDRSLYGSRAYASKNPTLSPITERLSFIRQSPAAQQTLSMSFMGKIQLLEGSNQIHSPDVVLSSFLPTDANQETRLNPEMATDTQVIADLAVTNTLETASQDPFTSPNSSEESATGKGRRLCGLRERRGGLKKRKVSAADSDLTSEELLDQTGGKTEQPCEEQTATSLEVSRGTPSKDTVPELGGVDTEELYQAASQQGNTQSSSASQEDGAVSDVALAPWQADFNFEDVFKPVATRGQRSVRRSLRNQSKAEHSSSAGLAWLPRTSPDSNKEARRKTRGRRLSAALPVQPSLPEELTSNLCQVSLH
uniref:PP1-binding domain-containing protein n=1 Tax=Stegastes partitus TaxID=144197 RepID=A0A3B5A5F0_9TELE